MQIENATHSSLFATTTGTCRSITSFSISIVVLPSVLLNECPCQSEWELVYLYPKLLLHSIEVGLLHSVCV